jgi:hypothetical protein
MGCRLAAVRETMPHDVGALPAAAQQCLPWEPRQPRSRYLKAGWRPGLRWTQVEFDKFCKQLEISK